MREAEHILAGDSPDREKIKDLIGRLNDDARTAAMLREIDLKIQLIEEK